MIDLGSICKKRTYKKRGTLVIKPYENKLMLLEKVALIATQKNNINIDYAFSRLHSLIDETSLWDFQVFENPEYNYLKSNAFNAIKEIYSSQGWSEKGIDTDFKNSCFASFIDMQSIFLGCRYPIVRRLNYFVKTQKSRLSSINFNDTTKFVVAGGFSAGKTTFINTFFQTRNLLPTAITPTSSIPTYIHFSNDNIESQILAQNNNDCFIDLGEDLLQQLKHGTEANDMIASVLKRIIIKAQSKKMNNVLIVDTPGHNNSGTKNEFNNKTDGAIAEEELQSCDVLVYFIEAESGTLKTSDWEFIQKADKPFYLIINKSGKKSESELHKIFEGIRKEVVGKTKKLKDIIAYDSVDQKVYKTLKVQIRNIEDIFKHKSEQEDVLVELRSLFNDFDKLIAERIDEAIKTQREWKEIGEEEEAKKEFCKIVHFRAIATTFNAYREEIVYEFKTKREEVLKEINGRKTLAGNLYQKSNKTVFETIEENNLLEFYDCFLNDGIDILKRNSLKYNPMTYATKMGNYEMVKFFIDKKIDPFIFDGRGYNMLHTAIENNHREIIRFLIKTEPELLAFKTECGKSIDDLVSENKFVEWFKAMQNNKYESNKN